MLIRKQSRIDGGKKCKGGKQYENIGNKKEKLKNIWGFKNIKEM